MEVTKYQFWDFIMGAEYNIISSVEPGPFPYTSSFKTIYGIMVGKIVDRYIRGSARTTSDYFLYKKE